MLRVGNKQWQQHYSFASRFQQGSGTNPEELLGAAHAGCFTMALAQQLSQSGFPPKSIDTIAKINLEKQPDGFGISSSTLMCRARVPSIDPQTFQTIAHSAKLHCPLSRALAGIRIDLEAILEHE